MARKSKCLAREEFLYTNLSFGVIQSFIDQISLMCQASRNVSASSIGAAVEDIVMLIRYFNLTDRSVLADTVIASFALDH